MFTTTLKKLVITAAIATPLALSLGVVASPSSALAVSPSQQQCEASGGTFNRSGGTVSCTYTTSDPVGNSEASGGKSQTRDTTTVDSSNGNLDNKNHKASDSTTSGPGNSGK